MLVVLELQTSQFHQILFYWQVFSIWSVLQDRGQNKEETATTFHALGEQFLSRWDGYMVCSEPCQFWGALSCLLWNIKKNSQFLPIKSKPQRPRGSLRLSPNHSFYKIYWFICYYFNEKFLLRKCESFFLFQFLLYIKCYFIHFSIKNKSWWIAVACAFKSQFLAGTLVVNRCSCPCLFSFCLWRLSLAVK